MKKNLISVIMCLLLTFIVGTAMGAEYTVNKGDTLSHIGNVVHKPWREIAKVNKMSAPYMIKIGQVLQIPEEVKIPKLGTAPFSKKPLSLEEIAKAIDLLVTVEPDYKVKLREAVRSGKIERGNIKKGDTFDEMLRAGGRTYTDVTMDFPEGHVEPARIFLFTDDSLDYTLTVPDACNNLAPKKNLRAAKVKAPVTQEEEIPAPPPFKIPGSSHDQRADKFEAIVGGGTYESLHHNAKGWYAWAKARYFPEIGKIGDNLFAGVHGFVAGGQGFDKKWDYKWLRAVIGPSLKLDNSEDGHDSNLDVGVGPSYMRGGEGGTTFRQKSLVGVVSVHHNDYSNRLNGETFLPKQEWNGEFIFPFSSKATGGKVVNETVIDLSFEQHLLDIALGNNVLFTPLVKIGGGYEWAMPSSFLQGGPGAAINWEDQQVFKFGVVNLKHMFEMSKGTQLHHLWANWGVTDTITAYELSQISYLSPKGRDNALASIDAAIAAEESGKPLVEGEIGDPSSFPPPPSFS